MKNFRFLILIGLIAVFIFQPAGLARADTLSNLEQRQAELDRQIEANQKALEAKKQQIKDTQSLITDLDNQISATETDINLSSQKIDVATQKINDLVKQITQKEQELAVQKENLFEAIRVSYEQPPQSTLEIVVASPTISALVDKAQQLEAVNYSIETAINKINELKAELENQRNQIEQERTDLENQKKALLDKRKGLDLQKNQKNQLLNQSVAEKANFQNVLSQLMKEHSQISSEIYAQRRAQGGISFGSSGYPFGNIDVPDPWLFLTRECTSYAAWYWNAKLGKTWYNTQPGRGSARYWDEIARTLGYTVSSTPQYGAFVVWRGPLYAGDRWGHVAIVEAVNGDGTINISEMNWISYSYSYRSGVRPGDYGSYYYILP